MNLSVAQTWGLSAPIDYLVQRKGFDPEQVKGMEREYRRYLAIVAAHPGEKLPISSKVDDLWHAHILHTKDYVDFTQALAGRLIGHVPTKSEDERQALECCYINGTLKRYLEMFEEEAPENFWPRTAGSICLDCHPDIESVTQVH